MAYLIKKMKFLLYVNESYDRGVLCAIRMTINLASTSVVELLDLEACGLKLLSISVNFM